MKRLGLIIAFFIISLSFFSVRAVAQTSTSSAFNGEVPMESLVATDAASASEAARLASESAAVAEKIQEKKDSDLTETGGKQKDKLAAFLDDNPPEPLAWNNFIQHAIRYAVNEGVPVNTLVLVLLFPMVASLIAASRHMIGLRGFGVYSPAVLSVALVSTGITEGILIFLAIVGTAVLAKRIIWRLKLSYLPRTAMLLWMISLGILGILFIAPSINVVTLMTVNIFPILILVLLAENFLDAQARTKQAEAIALTVETIGLAALSALLLKWEIVQKVALLEPELLIVSTALLNIIIGKFTGLRISERFRFRSIIEE